MEETQMIVKVATRVATGLMGIPELAAHMAQRRQRTLDAIERGLDTNGALKGVHPAVLTAVAQNVLESLEQMWRDDEAFS